MSQSESSEPTEYERALQVAKEAHEQAEQVRLRELSGVIEEMKRKIRLFNITAEELGFAVKTKTKADGSGGAPDGRSNVEMKYRGKQGQEWSGRGKKPKWVLDHIAEGGSLDDLTITRS